MKRWSAEPLSTMSVVRGEDAGAAVRAKFDVPLAERMALPADVTAKLQAEARATGYAAGWAEGCRAAEEATRADRAELAAQMRTAIASQQAAAEHSLRLVAGAVARFEQKAMPTIVGIEADLIAAAFALAEAIVGRELRTAAEPGADALRRALALAPVGRPVIVHLHPDEAADLPTRSTVEGREVVVRPDATMKIGDAVVECDNTTIDVRIDAAIERAREALNMT